MKFSQHFKFSEWPNRDIPLVAAGVYVIWHDDELIYCGMSGREIEKAIKENKRKYGLTIRLNSHAQERLSGNQFCVYFAISQHLQQMIYLSFLLVNISLII